jgi:co-chaperonin GroES (HSP10)
MKNESGIKPVEYKVLVKLDEIEEKTSGGIYRPGQTIDKERRAQVKGTIVDLGCMAFEDWNDHDRRTLEPGLRVYVAKYSGLPVEGVDGEEYQLVQDKDIAAIIVKEKVDD